MFPLAVLNTTDSFTAVMSGAAATTNPTYRVRWREGEAATVNDSSGSLSGATAVTLVAAPTGGQREIAAVDVFNADTAAVTVTLTKVANGTSYTVHAITLAVGDLLKISGDDVEVYDSSGRVRALITATYSSLNVADDAVFSLGNDEDVALVNRSTALTANTALAGVLVGTPVTPAVAANSLILANQTASGDILVAANRGGNSENYVFVDSSAGTLDLFAPLAAITLTPTTDTRLANGTGLVVGHTAQLTVAGVIPELQVLGTTTAVDGSAAFVTASVTNSSETQLVIGKVGNAALGSFTTVAQSENLGSIAWVGDDGTDLATVAARIRVIVNATGTVAASRIPADMIFYVDPGGADDAIAETFRLGSAGDAMIANGGGLIVGHNAQVTISDGDGTTNLIPEVQILGTSKTDGSLLLMVNSATATSAAAPSVNLVKSAHATLGSNTVVVSGEVLGEVNFFGADGTDFESCAVSIRGIVDTTPGTGDMPGRLSLFTSTDGAETPTERVRVTGTATASTVAIGIAGATTGKLTFAGTTSGVVTIQALAAAGTYTLSLPPDDGDAGEQLQTDGSGVMTWESAASMRAVKNVIAEVSDKAEQVLEKLLNTGVYHFQYKADARVGDKKTVYTGVMAEELPEVMHHDGRIFSPISAFGELLLAIKALNAKVDRLAQAQ